jgi:diphthine synthase
MLWLIGLGLFDEKDISVRGLEVIRQCDRVFLENYTSVLHVPPAKLSEFYGKEVIVADRELVESRVEEAILAAAAADPNKDVAFLVVGDPFGATTHADLQARAVDMGITVRTIHNASIMNAVAACGLQLYSFGQSVSIPFFTERWRPTSFYPRIAGNRSALLHTLCLLDIKVKEVSEENMIRGRMGVYEPPRFMTVKQALAQLREVEDAEHGGFARPGDLAVAVCRLGAPDQVIRAGSVQELIDADDLGGPLHALVIPAPRLHEMELVLLQKCFMLPGSVYRHVSCEEYNAAAGAAS